MQGELTKDLAQKLMGIKGEVRGVVFKTDTEYILAEKGEEGLKKLEEELEKLGHPIKYKEIETFSYYPIGLRALSLLATKKIFGFDDKKIEDMGFKATKKSLIIKFFIKHVFSLEKIFFQKGPKIWQEHWTAGEMIPIKLDKKEKYIILIFKDFNLHPVYCVYLKGYLRGLFSMMIKTPEMTCQETKCSFKGDEYHEYLIKWQ